MIIFYFQKVNVETVQKYIYMHIVANGEMGVMKQNCKLSI